VVAGVRRGLAQLLHGDRRRGQVGVAEPEVDYVLARAPQLLLQLVRDREQVRRERVDPAELDLPTLATTPVGANFS